MARRRKNDADGIMAIASLAGLLFFCFIVSPASRQIILAAGYLLMILLGLSFAGLVGFICYWQVRRSQRAKEDGTLRTFSMDTLEVVETKHEAHSRIPAMQKEQTLSATSDLIAQLRSIDWFQFEKVVALMYRKQGYAVTRRGGANADGGIDLIIEKDGVRKAVQCKQWKTWNVGVKAVREFVGALAIAEIQSGVFVTLGGYSGQAKQLADERGIEMLNEVGLARSLESTDAKYDPEVLEILRNKRKYCPKCESEKVLRTARKGENPGDQFWGCSAYPRCHYTMRDS